MEEKLYVIRKYIMAKSASDAIKKERSLAVDDVWVDDEWKRDNHPTIFGFRDKK